MTLTNGYHPLWMCVLTLLCLIFDPVGVTLHVVLWAVVAALSILLATLVHRLAGFLGLRARDAVVGAHAAQSLYLIRAKSGVAINLAVSAMAFFAMSTARFMDLPDSWRSLWLGFAVSLCVLSRIDIAIYVALAGLALFGFALRRSKLRNWGTPSTVGGFSLGFVPVALYFTVNLLVFDALMPVSGMAKQLTTGWFWNWRALDRIAIAPLQALGRVASTAGWCSLSYRSCSPSSL